MISALVALAAIPVNLGIWLITIIAGIVAIVAGVRGRKQLRTWLLYVVLGSIASLGALAG